MEQRHALITLADTLAAHDSVTHYAISMRIFRKGDFFRNLKVKNYDCRTRTAARAMEWFEDNWPEDLTWPSDIPRPSKSKSQEAA